MALPQGWRVFIESLNSNDVEYVVIGAVALAQHGYPRYTGDSDILIRNSAQNAARMERVLDEFGMGSIGLQAADFTAPDSVIQLGIPPFRIDLLTTCTGVSFEQAWSGRVVVRVDGIDINIIGRAELIQNKRMTGRTQDLADVERLEQSRPTDY